MAFTGYGDHVAVRGSTSGTSSRLDSYGPFADSVPRGEANLAMRAATRLAAWAGMENGAVIRLEKNVPVGAGLGGGSADAAAVLLALRQVWGVAATDATLQRIAFGLGADVPACLAGRSVRIRGAGECIEPVPLPPFWCALVWPGFEISTAKAFALLSRIWEGGPPLPKLPARFGSPEALASWLCGCRNDLYQAAVRLMPGLEDVREELVRAGAIHVSMSGSGSAHWGMFASEADTRRAVARISSARPGWWCEATRVGEVDPDTRDGRETIATACA